MSDEKLLSATDYELANLREECARLADCRTLLAILGDRRPSEVKVCRKDVPSLFTDADGAALYLIEAPRPRQA